jgi:hypothetical protein
MNGNSTQFTTQGKGSPPPLSHFFPSLWRIFFLALSIFTIAIPIAAADNTTNATNTTGQQEMSITQCTNTMAGVTTIWIFAALSIAFIILGAKYSKPLGIFAGIIMMFTAIYISACQALIGYIFGIGGVITLLYFALKH